MVTVWSLDGGTYARFPDSVEGAVDPLHDPQRRAHFVLLLVALRENGQYTEVKVSNHTQEG